MKNHPNYFSAQLTDWTGQEAGEVKAPSIKWFMNCESLDLLRRGLPPLFIIDQMENFIASISLAVMD